MATLTRALLLSMFALLWTSGYAVGVQTYSPVVQVVGASLVDVPGAELVSLPRYPGSVRVEYSTTVADGFARTLARYEVASDMDAVRAFYRVVFQQQGWSEVDAQFSQGQWSFLVVSGLREARIRLTARSGVADIAIDLSEPATVTGRHAPTPPRDATDGTPSFSRPDRGDSRHPSPW